MKRAHVDRTLTWILAVLVTAGVLVFLSASLSLLPKGDGAFLRATVSHLVLGLGGGALALIAALNVPLTFVKRAAPYVFGAALILCAAVFAPVIGLSVNGASRWINLGPVTFQPAELLKIAYVLYLAVFLASGKNRGADVWHGFVPFGVLSSLAAALLLMQPDTDTLIITVAAGASMMFAAGTRLRDIAVFGLVSLALLAALIFARPYLWERVQTFMDPLRDPLGSGYQIQQSLIAIGSGEVWGRGFGTSIQKFNYLPEASTDSIFAVFAEEFGLIGGVVLIGGFLAFALRGLTVSARAGELYGALVALGIVVLIVGQAYLNIAAMTGLVPVGGLPLPFVSRGGSALLLTLCMAGLLLNVSRTMRS
jgi:cell division protein FtsW